jgi:hypothetical protein
MREKQIETKLRDEARKRGGMALKFTSPGFAGVPDRLILMPYGKAAFAEMKAPGEKMRRLQLRRKSQIEQLGFKVYCIDGVEQIGGVLDEICSS